MDDEYQYYDVPSGVMPWRPPAGFEDPVPPARGDALPPGHSRSWLAGLRGGGGDHEGRASARWLLIAIGIILLAVFVAKPFVEDVLDRGNELLDEIEKTIDEAKKSTESNVGEGGRSLNTTPVSETDADGRSNLPGRYASLRYEPLSNEAEWRNEQNIDSRYDGSVWGVSRAGTGGASYLMLSYFNFQPPITDAAGREAFAVSVGETLPSADGAEPKRSDVTVDGRDGFEYSYTQKNGTRTIVTYFLGDEHSYRYDCQAGKGDDAFWTSCVDAQETLKFRR